MKDTPQQIDRLKSIHNKCHKKQALEIDGLKKELQIYREAYARCGHEREALHTHLYDAQKQNEDLAVTIQDLEGKVFQERDNYRCSEDRNDKLRQLHQMKHEEYDCLARNNEKCIVEYAALQQEYISLHGAKSVLDSKLKEYTSANKGLILENGRLRSEVSALLDANATLDAKLSGNIAVNNDLKAENARLTEGRKLAFAQKDAYRQALYDILNTAEKILNASKETI